MRQSPAPVARHDPGLTETLGPVPVAVIERAKACGVHALSGAVMRPEPLLELFPDVAREQWREEGFAYGEVATQTVYLQGIDSGEVIEIVHARREDHGHCIGNRQRFEITPRPGGSNPPRPTADTSLADVLWRRD
jgi:hypothetical protein